MPELVTIYASIRSNDGKYQEGFMNESTPPCLGYYRIDSIEATRYSLEAACKTIWWLARNHPEAVFVFHST